MTGSIRLGDRIPATPGPLASRTMADRLGRVDRKVGRGSDEVRMRDSCTDSGSRTGYAPRDVTAASW